jgi:ATP-dependent Clp protease ATP-binding subunit ClpB
MKRAVMEIVGVQFRPEFVNGIDEVLAFHPLGREQIRVIARIQREYLRRRLVERDITWQVSATALDRLGEAGFDPVHGVRPLKRGLQQPLANLLVQRILAGEWRPESLNPASAKPATAGFVVGSERSTGT